MTTEKAIKEYAEKVSENITIRKYDEIGNSKDEERKSTPEEQVIIKAVITCALLSAKGKFADIQTAADTAEFIGDQLLPGANGYLSFYQPIERFFIEESLTKGRI